MLIVHSLLAVGPAPAQSPADKPPTQPQRPIHIVPWKSGLNTASTPVGAHLNYFGGPVMSNVHVVVVYWGSAVSSVVTAGMPSFYQGVTNSTYFDMLSEYSTDVTPPAGGTNQSIGRGSYVGATTITPSVTSNPVDDTQIQTELIAQIQSGHLSPPQYDLAGDTNTLYMIYFPPALKITQGGGGSCAAGGFCAYHGTALYNGKFLPYGVVPDFGPGSGCDTGCGNKTEFQNLTSVSSHELAESVTDAAVGQAGGAVGWPLAWYDNSNGEIADICNAQQSSISTPTGTFVIQNEFSNAVGDCVSSGLHPSFQLTAPASALTGVPFNVTLTAKNPTSGQGTDTSFIGTVSFGSSDASATLPAEYTFVATDQGTRTFSVTLLNVPSSISATDTVNQAITATASLTATSDFSLSASPGSLSIQRGASGNSTISTAVIAGSAQAVALSVTGVPSGATASFSPASVTAGGSSAFIVNTGTAATGNYLLAVNGTEGSVEHLTSISLTVTQGPAISSAASTTFTVGTAGSFTVTASGFPAPTLSEAGALPSGVTFNPVTGVLSGTPTVSGSFPITFTASNGVGSPATQNFTLTVNRSPAISSAASTTFTVGTAGSFTVTASGFPAPTLSEAGALPSGVTFNPVTGVLSGTPTVSGSFPITFTANNGVGSPATQNFTLTVDNFAISATPMSVTTKNLASFAVTLTSTGLSGNVTPVCSGNPTGSTCTFSPATVLVNGTATTTATVVLDKRTHGTYTLTFTATLGTITRTANVTLIVK